MREIEVDKLKKLEALVWDLKMDVRGLIDRVQYDLIYKENGERRLGYDFEDCVELEVRENTLKFRTTLLQYINRLGMTKIPSDLDCPIDPMSSRSIQDIDQRLAELLRAVECLEILLKEHTLSVCKAYPTALSEDEKQRLRNLILGVEYQGEDYPIHKWKNVHLLIGYLHSRGFIEAPGVAAPTVEKALGVKNIKKLNRVNGSDNPLFGTVILIAPLENSQGNSNGVWLNPEAKIEFAKKDSGK